MALLTQYSIFFVSPFGEGTACDELNKFLKSNRIINVEKRLIDGERGTGWLFLVEYGNDNKSTTQNSSQKIDYREILNEQEYSLFDKLRQVRKELAEKQGIPVYAIFTNEHLSGMVKKHPASLKDIGSLPGVGESRVKQYGSRFLEVFAQLNVEAAVVKLNETSESSF